MQKNIHPQYRPVVFRDRSAGESFLTNSTRTSDKSVTWEDGREYPVIDVEVSCLASVLDRSRHGAGHRRARRALPPPLRRQGAPGEDRDRLRVPAPP